MTPKRIPTESIVSSVETVLSRQRDLSVSSKDNIRSRTASMVQSAPIPDNNLTKDEQQALKRLKNDNNLVILPADKGRVTELLEIRALELLGIKSVLLQFFSGYLANRRQYVQLMNTVSSTQTVTCGIPQGSSLRPILFLIYVNEIPYCCDTLKFRIFADDTNVFASTRDLEAVEQLMNS